MVKYLDDVVGNLTTALKQHGLWDKLLFITSSDNGGPIFQAGNNFPLRGGKYSNFQGGIRVNAFVSGGYLPRTDIPISYDTLISGDYKIITGDVEYGVWTGPQFPNTTTTSKQIHITAHCGDGCSFDINEDPYEYENLATKRPDVLAQMQKKLQKYQSTYFNPDRGKTWPGACATALDKYGGFWGPFEP